MRAVPHPSGSNAIPDLMQAGQWASLRQKKRIAALLLFGALLLLAVSTWAGRVYPHWGWLCLTAFAEAALVGGLADWFAVVALFRHPLGLKVPHTAIIPHKKNQIGESLADFVRDHFLGAEPLLSKIQAFDPAAKLGQALSEPSNSEKVAAFITDSLPSLITLLDSPELQRFIHSALQREIGQTDVSLLLGQLLDLLTRDGKHQEAVNEILQGLNSKLQSPELREELRDMIGKKVRAVGRMLNVDDVATRLLADAGISKIDEVLDDPNHRLRTEIDTHVQEYIARLKSDPDLRNKFARLRDDLLGNEAVARYLQGVWGDILDWLRRDLQQERSAIRQNVRKASLSIGALLTGDAHIRELFNRWCVNAAAPLIRDYREVARNYIVERVEEWSAQELTDQLEISIGADLQYIRYNGTVIGGLIGLAIFGLLHLAVWVGGSL